jgi:hypothetical protein
MIVSISWMAKPKLRGWGEDTLSKWPSNPHDPHGHPNTYLAANGSTRVRRSASIKGSCSHWAQSASQECGSQWVSRVMGDPPIRVSWLSYGPIDPLYKQGWEERPPNWGLIPFHKAQSAPWLQFFWGQEQIPPIGVSWLSFGPIDPLYEWGWEGRPPNQGLIPSHKAQLAPQLQFFWGWEQIPPIGVSWLSYGPINPLYEWGWEERPPNWGLILSHKA